MFTKQYYRKVAIILARVEDLPTRIDLFNSFCDVFERDNPLFDKAKFAYSTFAGYKQTT